MRRLIPRILAAMIMFGLLAERARGADGPPTPERVLAGNLRLLETGTGEMVEGLQARDVSFLAEIYLAVEADIPYELLQELRDVRQGLRQLVGSLDTLRDATREQVLIGAGRKPIEAIHGLEASDQELLSRVDSILQNGFAD